MARLTPLIFQPRPELSSLRMRASMMDLSLNYRPMDPRSSFPLTSAQAIMRAFSDSSSTSPETFLSPATLRAAICRWCERFNRILAGSSTLGLLNFRREALRYLFLPISAGAIRNLPTGWIFGTTSSTSRAGLHRMIFRSRARRRKRHMAAACGTTFLPSLILAARSVLLPRQPLRRRSHRRLLLLRHPQRLQPRHPRQRLLLPLRRQRPRSQRPHQHLV